MLTFMTWLQFKDTFQGVLSVVRPQFNHSKNGMKKTHVMEINISKTYAVINVLRVNQPFYFMLSAVKMVINTKISKI